MDIDKIIANIVAGKGTKEELQQLQGWRSEAADNINVLQQIQDISVAAGDMYGYEDVDIDKAWDRVDSRIDHSPAPQGSNWMLWIAIVAALVAGAYYFTNRSSTGQSMPLHYAASDVVLPVTLPDGSIITLDAGSSIDIKEDYIDAPYVELDGRAYFDIAKQPEGTIYTIQLDNGQVEVVGTAFSIVDRGDDLEVAVNEGHVVYRLGDRSVDMLAGDKINLIANTIAKTRVDRANYFSWNTKDIVFEDVALVQAIDDLEWHYTADIRVAEGVSVADCKISASYSTETLLEVMQEWKLLLDIDYEVSKEGVILITAARCAG